MFPKGQRAIRSRQRPALFTPLHIHMEPCLKHSLFKPWVVPQMRVQPKNGLSISKHKHRPKQVLPLRAPHTFAQTWGGQSPPGAARYQFCQLHPTKTKHRPLAFEDARFWSCAKAKPQAKRQSWRSPRQFRIGLSRRWHLN